jgi:hypothetical protein
VSYLASYTKSNSIFWQIFARSDWNYRWQFNISRIIMSNI